MDQRFNPSLSVHHDSCDCKLCLDVRAARKLAEKKSAGLKFDTGKPPMELLSTEWLEGVAKVLEFGAKKYASDNWRQGIQIRRLIGAAMRHITRFNDGENLDPETGLSHLYHASCCLMFASELMIDKPEMDDRYKRIKYRDEKECSQTESLLPKKFDASDEAFLAEYRRTHSPTNSESATIPSEK